MQVLSWHRYASHMIAPRKEFSLFWYGNHSMNSSWFFCYFMLKLYGGSSLLGAKFPQPG